MDSDLIETAAATIWDARQTGRRLTGLAPELTPQTIADGFAVQRAIVSASGERVAGWKIACTAKPVQELFGVDEPFFGAVFESVVFASPARVEAARYRLGCVESEVAFRLRADLVPRPEPYANDEVMAAVDAVMPAFELIEPRFDSLLTDAAPLAFADLALNGGLVLGEAVSEWRHIDLAALPITLRIDGAVAAEGQGASALGHPLNAVTWLANALSRHGVTLAAGQVVASGTCTGINYVTAGQAAAADFGPLGKVEMHLV